MKSNGKRTEKIKPENKNHKKVEQIFLTAFYKMLKKNCLWLFMQSEKQIEHNWCLNRILKKLLFQ